MNQTDLDARIQSYYGELFDEHVRLTTRSAQGPLEFLRTQEIVRAHVSGGSVLDIGGGAGVHAQALAAVGFDVVLIDPVPRHVERARSAGVTAQVADARDLPFTDSSFDSALMLGPLYHLASKGDRVGALREASRVVRPGGMVFAAALSRYIAFGKVMLGRPIPEPFPGEWVQLAATGTPSPGRFPAGHFHTAEELEAEVSSVGLDVLEVVGVEGPAGALLESLVNADAQVADAALTIARAASSQPGIRDMSAHLIAIARVPG